MQVTDEMVRVAHDTIERMFFDGSASSEEAVRAALTAALAAMQDHVIVPRDNLLSIISTIDNALGDTDPSIDADATDEEVRADYPIFWACQQLSAMLPPAPSQLSKRDDAERDSRQEA